MKSALASAVALGFALTQVAATASLADQTFRSAAPQTFSVADLERYGLAGADAERALAYQEQGYRLVVLTPEEAEQYTAGITDNQWLLLAILAGVIVIAVAVAD